MKKMWKRFVSLLLACTLLAGMLPLSASAQATAPGEEELTWVTQTVGELNDKLTGTVLFEKKGAIPIQGSDLYAVQYQRSYSTDVFITETILFIVPGKDADLDKCIIPNTDSTNSVWANSGAIGLYIADGVTEIGNHAFDGMSTLETVEFQDSTKLTKVGEYAFNNCDKMVGLSLDLSNVTTLGKYAFNGCERLGSGENNKGVTLNDALTTIPENAFNTCGLKNVNIPKSCTKIEKNAFAHNSLSEVGELVLPDGLVTIGDSAFVVTMGSGETGIGITSLTIPSSVKSIGANAFSGRRNLAEVTVEDDNNPGTTLTLGDHAFGYNESSAFSEWGSITDAANITYTGNLGTEFHLPADIAQSGVFENGKTCYTGDISPMTYDTTLEPTCTTAGYHQYKTTISGAITENGEPVEVQYRVPLGALGHKWGEIKEVGASCERDGYFYQDCVRTDCEARTSTIEGSTGLFDTETGSALTPEEMEDYTPDEAEGHTYRPDRIEAPILAASQKTVLHYVCKNPKHDDERDSTTKDYPFTLQGKTLFATTTDTLNDLTSQLTGFSSSGIVSWDVEGNQLSQEFGEEGTKYVNVKFTPKNAGVFTDNVFSKDSSGTHLQITIQVKKAVVDLSGFSFSQNAVSMDQLESATVTASGFGGDAKQDGKIEFYNPAGGTWASEMPTEIGGDYKVRVPFSYETSKFRLPTDSEDEYPQDGSKIVTENGKNYLVHDFAIIIQSINATVRAKQNLVYDGTEKTTVSVSSLRENCHVAFYLWENDDWVQKGTYTSTKAGDSTEGISLKNAGTYKVKVEITLDQFETQTEELEVTIAKAPVQKPVAKENLQYLPKETQQGFESLGGEDELYIITGGTGVDAKTYTATATLNDSANYCWQGENASTATVQIPWTILPQRLTKPNANSARDYSYQYGQYREPLTTTAGNNYDVDRNEETGLKGVYYIGNQENEGYEKEYAYTVTNSWMTDAKEYTSVVHLNDNKNYVWHDGSSDDVTIHWEIRKATLELPNVTVKTEAKNVPYDGEAYEEANIIVAEKTLPGDVVPGAYEYARNEQFSGATENAPTDAGDYFVRRSYTYNADNYAVVGSIPFASFTITPAEATMTFTEGEETATYTAQGTPLQQVKVTNLVTVDVGKPASDVYTVTYTYKYRNDNTDWEEVKTETTIEEPNSFKFTDVGEYQITATFSSNNYTAADATYTLTIKKANAQKITLTSAGTNKGQWNEENKTYTTTYGAEASFTITGTAALDEPVISYKVKDDSEKGPDGNTADVVSVDSTGEVTIKQAGEATITVTAANTDNVKGASVEYTVTVKKAKPTVNTGLEGDELTVAYTGKAIEGYDKATPTANVVDGAEQPTGDITYTFYTDLGCSDENKVTNGGGKDGNIPIAVGTYYMKATYPGDTNYLPAESKVVTVIVTEAQLTVDAKGYADTYDGDEHDPASITVTGVNGVISSGYTISYAKKTDDQPPEADDEWRADLQVKDVADSGDYWFKVVIDEDDSYNAYIGSVKVTIDPRQLTVTKKVIPTKVYDGTVDATKNVTFQSINTGVDGEKINVTGTHAEYNSAEVGASSITITYTLEAVGTTALANYTVSTDGGEITDDGLGTETVKVVDGTPVGIDPAPITVAISNQSSVYDGSAPTVSNAKDTDWKVTDGEIYQFVPDTDDDLGIILSIASGSKDAGAYAITGEWTNKNYDVTFTGSWTGGTAGTYTITPRPIKVEIGNAEGFYGDEPDKTKVELTDISEGNPDTGLVSGDSLDDFLSGVTIDATASTGVGNDYSIVGEAQKYGNYDVTFSSGTYTVKARPITITIADHSSKYGAAINGGIAKPVSGTDYTVAITNEVTTGDAIVNSDDLGIALSTTANKDSNAGTYPISGEAKAEPSVVSNYAITWAGETPWNGSDQDSTAADSAKGTYTIDKAQLKVSVNRSDIYAQYGEEISNPVTFTNESTGQKIASDASDYTALSQAITYGMEPQGGLTQVEGSENAEGKFTVAVTQQMVTVTVNVAATENYEAATEITYRVHASASGSLDVSLPFADLTYNGQPQQLLAQAPELPDGVYIRYKVGESGEWTAYSDKNQDNWKEVVGENAGSYTVYWETTSSGNYNASSGNSNTSIAKATLEGSFAQKEYTHVLTTGNSYDSATANPLTITSQNYKANPANYTYYSDNMKVASSANGTSTIVITGTAGESATIRVTVPGDNNYNEGTFTYRLEISDDLSKIEYSVGNQEVTYNGQPQTIAVKVSEPDSGATVMYWNEKASAYDLSEPPAYTDVQAGGYPIKFQITAPGYEAVTDEATLKIEPKDISQCKVEGIAESYTYVGHQIVPETVAVVDGSVILTKDTDYTLEYGANQEVGEGEGSVIIKGTGNYTGEVTVYFNIAPVDGSSGMTASIDPAYGTYDPDGNTATVTVTHQTGTDSHEVTLTAENASYTITATDLVTGDPITERGATGTGNTLTFTKPAIYDITLKLTGDHQGEFHLSYTLLPLSNEDGGLTLTVDDETQKVFTYGGEIDPSDATIKVTANNTDVTDQCTLTYVYTPFEGTPTTTASPYTAEVLKNAGVYTVTATPTDGSAITGTGTFTFLILQRDLSKATLAVEDDNLVYNQAAQEPDVTVTVDGNAQPTEDADYTVTYYNNVNASKEAKAVVTAKGNNFTGSNTENFSIAPKEITDEMVKEIPEQYYTGNAVIPPVTITDGNYTLILGYDYTTACDAIGPGTATVTIEGKGNYTETTTKDFVIKSEGAPEPSERFDLVVTPSQWIWKDDLTNLRLSVTFGTGNELTLGKEYTLEVNGQTFDGTTGKTKDDALTYIKGLKPGEYTITATGVDAYKDSEDTETVTVKKIQPELTVTAAPGTLSGGGKVTLTLKGENLPDFAEGQDLSNLLAATAKDAKNNPDLSELEWETDEQTGVMTAELTLPNTNETYTFTLTFIETATHAGATDSEQVVVAQQIISGGGGGGPVEDQPANPDDTGVSDWLNTKDHLAYLAGYPGGTFGPDQNMTRAEAAQMFYNLLLEKDVEITVEFEDVPADAWYAKPVNTLASLGILSGVGNGRFDPERSITRAEFTVIAMKFANTSGGGVNIFSDVNEDDWFYSAVVDSTQYGWINGYPDGTFRPEATISRAEVTVIVNHMLGRAADRPYVIAHEEELNTFGDVNRGHWGYFHVAEATNAHEYHTEDGTESWTGLS